MMEYWNIEKTIFFLQHSIIPLFHSSIPFLLCTTVLQSIQILLGILGWETRL